MVEQELNTTLGRSYQRVGKALMLNEDFFSYTFVSEINISHALVTLFKSKIKQETEEKKIELDEAMQNYKTAEAELEIAQKMPSITNQALEFNK